MQVLPPSLPPLSLFRWFAGFDRFLRIPRSQRRERSQGEMDSSNLLCVKCTLHYNKHMKKADWFLLWKDLYDDFVQEHGHESIRDYKDAGTIVFMVIQQKACIWKTIYFQKVGKSVWICWVKGHLNVLECTLTPLCYIHMYIVTYYI